MNKTAIKNFAIWARVQLMEAAKQRAFEYGITEGGENKPDVDVIAGRLLSSQEIKLRNQLIVRIQQKGFTQVMEEAAYTWFNRFIALRFMEVNGYLPSKIRVFTDETGAFKPEILKQALSVDLDALDRNKVLSLLDAQENEELYKYLLITQCNALSASLPLMFEKIENWTELLFPASLLRPGSVLDRLVTDIPEEDWLDQVQIIGWLYQYYNAERKDEVFTDLKKNIKINKDTIAPATQLFTPDWIVRYMVENSLGRLWKEGHPNFDTSAWRYYLDEAEQEPEVQQKLDTIRAERVNIKPEEIKFIDPCMGSGHILVYAFDVLMQIYLSSGYSERDAAKSIIENNLFGLDIDDRAGQLAYFALMMKARQYDSRFLTRGVQPHVYAIQESNALQAFDRLSGQMRLDSLCLNTANELIDTYRDAKEYGSLLSPKINSLPDVPHLMRQLEEVSLTDLEIHSWYEKASRLLPQLARQTEVLQQRYDVVVTNPPYMGSSGMNALLSSYVKEEYPDSKSDLFACFMERCGAFLKPKAYQAMITQHAWMFLTSFERLRTNLLKRQQIINMAHLGARAFEEIGGEVVQTTAFVLSASHIPGYHGTYCRLIDPTTQQGKEDMFLAGNNCFVSVQDNFSKIPGNPVAYWVSNTAIKAYDNLKVSSLGKPCKGIDTGNNDRFLRLWYEVENSIIVFNANINRINDSINGWVPYNKGGSYRKWYGNKEYVLNWKNDAKELKSYSGSNLRNKEYYFKECLTWSTVTSGVFSIRYSNPGSTFDNGGSSLFSKNHLYFLLAFLNSRVAYYYLTISPTLNSQPGDIGRLPIITSIDNAEKIDFYAKTNIALSIDDWDSFETSWDFKKHPLI